MAAPLSPKETRTRQIVDAIRDLQQSLGSVVGPYLPLAGGTVTGAVTFTGSPYKFTLGEGVAGDRVEITKHASPGDYSTTKASFVVQHQEDNGGAELANGTRIDGVLFTFLDATQGDTASSSSSGVVTMRGVRSYTNKTYDGSAHCFTATFELDENGSDLSFAGADGYNEGGAFQATMTNIGSSNGYMSAFEAHLRDSPDDGTNDYATRMTGLAVGIKKYNSSSLPAYSIHALNEGSTGSLDLDAVLKIEASGNGDWKTGLDLYDDGSWDFATLLAMKIKENNKIRWSDGTHNTDIYVNANGIVVFTIAGTGFFPGTDNDKTLGGPSNLWSTVYATTYYSGASITIDAAAGIRFPGYAATAIADIGDAVNTANKAQGKAVYDTTNHRIMVADGATAGSAWYVADGSASVTPA